MGLTWKETTQSLESDESRDYKESVAKYRRKCQRGKKDVKPFLRKKVPQVAKLKENVIVGMDRGFHFKPHEVEDELKKGGAKNIEDVWIFPTNAGKLCNPLDNNLWHSMKQNVRKSHPDGEGNGKGGQKGLYENSKQGPPCLLPKLCAYAFPRSL